MQNESFLARKTIGLRSAIASVQHFMKNYQSQRKLIFEIVMILLVVTALLVFWQYWEGVIATGYAGEVRELRNQLTELNGVVDKLQIRIEKLEADLAQPKEAQYIDSQSKEEPFGVVIIETTPEATLTLTPTEVPSATSSAMEVSLLTTITPTPTVTSSYTTPTATPEATETQADKIAINRFCEVQPTSDTPPPTIHEEYGEWHVFACWAFAQIKDRPRNIAFTIYKGDAEWTKPEYRTLDKPAEFQGIMLSPGIEKYGRNDFHPLAIFLFVRKNGGVDAITFQLDTKRMVPGGQIYLDRFEYEGDPDEGQSLFIHEDGLTVSRGNVQYSISPESYDWTIERE